jgi:hypothetical protein
VARGVSERIALYQLHTVSMYSPLAALGGMLGACGFEAGDCLPPLLIGNAEEGGQRPSMYAYIYYIWPMK